MNMNFKNFGNDPPPVDGVSGRLPGNFPITRQGSIYSLTFDELQNTMGGLGKDFGSMNMDELLKSIFSAEEPQSLGNTCIPDGGIPSGYLQRQGSLTLPRTLSQKTVDEVWRDISKEYCSGFAESSFPQRQQTLGNMTLEEFLVKAGVVREEAQVIGKSNDSELFGNMSNSQNNPSFVVGFQSSNKIPDNVNPIGLRSGNLPLSFNGSRSTQQQPPPIQPKQLFPKNPALTYGTTMAAASTNGQLGSPVTRGGVMGISDPRLNGNLVPSGGLQGGCMGIVAFGAGAGAVSVATGSPAVSSDGIGKSNGDASSVSPTPYVFNGILRGRKSGAVEKVVERRQRRMIKNRESAARSRARKQAYTMELEAEVQKLKEQNHELRKTQAEMMEMQKNQAQQMISSPMGVKRRCLRRTQTGPW